MSTKSVLTTTTTVLWPFVWDYPGEPVPEETFTQSHLSWSSINHPLSATSIYYGYIASSLFNLRAWQSFCTTSLQDLFGLPLDLQPFVSYFIHFFFVQHMLYHCNLFRCNTVIYFQSLKSLLGTLSFTLMLHIHLTILISARWSATSFSFLTGQVSLPCNILLHT